MQMVRDYLIFDHIASGGLGRVFLGKPVAKLNQPGLVTIKIYDQNKVQDEAVLQQIENECKIGRQVTHPNLVKCLDSFIDNGCAYVIQEYVGGVSLRHFMNQLAKAKNRVGLAQVFEFGLKFSEVLSFMHSQVIPNFGHGLVHGDIQPSNIMFNKAGELKLIDYGLSGPNSMVSKEAGFSEYVSTAYVGKRRLQTGVIAKSDDIIAFGFILWELVAGQSYYEGKDKKTVIKEVMSGHIKPLVEYSTRTTAEISNFVYKCMTSDGVGGFSDFREIRQDLQNFHREFQRPDEVNFSEGLRALCRETYEKLAVTEAKINREALSWKAQEQGQSSF